MQFKLGSALLAVAVLGSACEGGSSTGPAAIEFEPAPPPAGDGFVAQYAPPVDAGPYPNDIYNAPGETVDVPVKRTRPLAQAVNTLDGFSTTAPITAPFNAPVDPATLVPLDPLAPTGNETLFVLNVTAGAPLVPGVDYDVRLSTAAGTNGAVVEIVPLVPLAPDTTYAFLLTSGIESAAGVAATADTVFRLVRDAHLAGQSTGNPDLDALLPAIGPLVDLGVNLLGLPGTSIVSAWSVSTQSIGDVLEHIDTTATAQPAVLAPTGMTTADVSSLLPGTADIHTGYLEIPYFGDPAAPLTSFWVNAGLVPPTRDDPAPIPQGGQLRIPLLATLPNATSGQTAPADGWPVIVLQHGVTANRTVLLTMADAFAQAGFAAVAIDLPLHGITDVSNPLYQGPDGPFGDNERHFNLDNVGPVGDLEPDGVIDNGWQIFNVQNPLNARDHARQAVSDLIHLLRTVPNLDFDGDAAGDLDAVRIHFVSVSLGSIFGMPFLAVNDDYETATLTSPGGPYMEFLTDPNAIDFGLPIRAGIAAAGLPFGTVGFADFARDLQTVLDAVDPLNYAAAIVADPDPPPIHVIEVLGDTAVPPALTENLAALMGLEAVGSTVMDAGGVRGIVRFTAGGHTSIFNPQVDPAVTVEMQTQTAGFAASNGTLLPVSDESLVQ